MKTRRRRSQQAGQAISNHTKEALSAARANDLTVGITALVAQQDREVLSVARSRGVRLGNPNGAAALRRAGKAGAPLRDAITRNADAHARDLAPVLADIQASL